MKKENFTARRREARIISFQSLYAYDFEKKPLIDILKFDWLTDNPTPDTLEYAKKIIKGTIDHLEEIDNMIQSHLRNWALNRISLVDKAILRFSIYSLLFDPEKIADKVIINEAIEIVKLFGTQDSYKFVNGLLDAIKKNKNKQ
ncbi:MAG: transcription antitermination factor NusB [Spirochaetes bacterium]|nr:transcription antitermination factor NusB [Spirochaetota bacterium]